MILCKYLFYHKISWCTLLIIKSVCTILYSSFQRSHVQQWILKIRCRCTNISGNYILKLSCFFKTKQNCKCRKKLPLLLKCPHHFQSLEIRRYQIKSGIYWEWLGMLQIAKILKRSTSISECPRLNVMYIDIMLLRT